MKKMRVPDRKVCVLSKEIVAMYVEADDKWLEQN